MLKKLFTIRNLVILLAVVALFFISNLLGVHVVLPEISIVAEPVFHIGGFAVTNALLTSWIAMLVLVLLAWRATRTIPKDLETASPTDLVPKGHLQNAIEWLIEGFYGLTKEIGGTWAARFFPVIMTIFLFIIVSNWLGLVPGFGSIGVLEEAREGAKSYVANGAILTNQPATEGHEGYILVPLFRSPSTDLNFPLALALISVGLTQYFGVRALKLGYFSKFINVHGFKNGIFLGVVEFLVGLLEIVTEFAKIISFSFRLFGNIFAGEVLLGVMAFLIPYVISLPFYGLELFVGFIQAVVFMMLTLVFFASSTVGHGSEEHH